MHALYSWRCTATKQSSVVTNLEHLQENINVYLNNQLLRVLVNFLSDVKYI